MAKHTTKTKETKDGVFTDREAKGWADWETHGWLGRLVISEVRDETRGFAWAFGILCLVAMFGLWSGRDLLIAAGLLVMVGLLIISRTACRATQLLAECVRLLGLIHKPESEESILDVRRRLTDKLQSLWALERVAAWNALPSDRSFTRSEAESIVRSHLPTNPYVNWWRDLKQLGVSLRTVTSGAKPQISPAPSRLRQKPLINRTDVNPASIRDSASAHEPGGVSNRTSLCRIKK